MKIATLQLLICLSLLGCKTTRPKTDTAVPSLNTAIYQTKQLQSSIGRALTRNERMDYKASLLEDGPDTTQKFDKKGNPNFGR